MKLRFRLPTNLILHFANALLVLVLVRQVCLCSAIARRSPDSMHRHAGVTQFGPCIRSGLPVLYVVQRMTSLSAFFMLLGSCLYMAGRQNPGRLGLQQLRLAYCCVGLQPFFPRKQAHCSPFTCCCANGWCW